MKFFIIVTVLCVAAAGANKIDSKNYQEIVNNVFSLCKTEEGLADEEFDKLFKGGQPTSMAAKCTISCFSEKVGRN